MPFKVIIGVYCIRNKVNNKVYIGSAVSYLSRLCGHKNLLKKNKHFNNHLQASWNKYGEDNFEFFLLESFEILNKEELLAKETSYIIQYKANIPEYGFNKRLVVHSNIGTKRTPESREKMRQVHLGKKHPEWRNKIKSETSKKKICQYDLDGSFIKEWASIMEASAATNTCKVNISMNARKITKRAGQFMWNYEKLDKLEKYNRKWRKK